MIGANAVGGFLLDGRANGIGSSLHGLVFRAVSGHAVNPLGLLVLDVQQWTDHGQRALEIVVLESERQEHGGVVR